MWGRAGACRGAVLAGGMKEARDGLVGGLQLVVPVHGRVGRKHVGVHARVVEPVEGLWLYLEPLVHAAGQDHDRGSMLQQFLHVGRLNARRVGRAGLVPVPPARPARIQLGVLERPGAVVGCAFDLKAAP